MKSKFTLAILIILVSWGNTVQAQENDFFKKADRFFKIYVHHARVDYKGIREKPQALHDLVKMIADFNLSELPEGDAQKAFWMNTYNLLVIQGVVANAPAKSPLDIGGFFDRIKYRAARDSLTLNDIENKKIRAVYRDARIHFVLVCAAQGCPSLISKAYFPQTLSQQLDKQTRVSLNTDLHVYVDHSQRKVFISEIFKWYRDDFISNGKTIIQYINQFREEKIPKDYAVDYIRYDWRVNEYVGSSHLK